MPLQIMYYTLLLLTVFHLPQVRSVFFYSKNKLKIAKNESYTFKSENLEIKQSGSKRYSRPPGVGDNLHLFRNVSRNYSADERCEIGLPLSMAVYPLSPYASSNMVFKFRPKMNVTINGTTRTIPQAMEQTFTFFGVFVAILKKALPICCHPNADIRYAKLLFEQSIPADVDPANDYDFSFPVYGDSMEATVYRSNSFIPIIQAPSVALLVLSDSVKNQNNTDFIAVTIFGIWPMFIFLLLTAALSGVAMWLLDSSKNKEQFPKPFVFGAWEGFWWAFITMTTVGYGDRTPKSFLARFFCILWIIFSVIIVSVFSGLITAAISASTKKNFYIHGAKIGAVSGSEEFRFGLSLNADMQAYGTSVKAFAALHYHKTIAGLLIDNYIANSFSEELIKHNIRIDRMMDHSITYGLRMVKGSERLEKCMRIYFRDHPQEVFDMFSKSLIIVKNPNDHENQQHKEARKLFYEDKKMTKMLIYGAISVACILCLGLGVQLVIYCVKKRKARASKFTHHIVSDTKWGLGSMEEVDRPLKELLKQYNCFQNGWVKKMKAIHQEY